MDYVADLNLGPALWSHPESLNSHTVGASITAKMMVPYA